LDDGQYSKRGIKQCDGFGKAPRPYLAKVEQPVEHGAVLGAVEPLELPHVFVLVVGGY
jgi:hypothetical protein